MGLLPSWFTVQVARAPMPLPFFQALREIEIETSIGRASILRMHFDLSRNIFGDFDALAFDIFRPLVPITIRLAAGPPIPQTLINGYVKDAQLSAGNTPGTSRLEVVAMDALGTIMAHVQQPFPWPNLSDSAIAETIFGNYAMLALVDPLPPSRTENDTTSNQCHYDAAYLIQLAGRNCFELYIQPAPVIGADVGHFHRPLTNASPQGVLSIDFGKQTNLSDFSVSNDMLRPASVAGSTIDPTTRAPIPSHAPVSTELPMGREPALNRFILPPAIRCTSTDAANPSEAQMQAFARATCSSRAITARGEVDGLKYTRALLAGLPVLVRGAGQQHSGLYYVQTVTHKISRDNYTQNFTAWRNAVGLTGAEVFFDPLEAVA